MIKKKIRKIDTQKRHKRVRLKIEGTAERPRLAVFRSNKHIYAQVIDDTKGLTLASAGTVESVFKAEMNNGGNVEASKVIGKLIAQRAKEKGINKVVFDRGGNLYHGRIAAVADAARENGIEF
ncbi:MAG TPA: 50S ribosomal protein L18 [Candidatus Gastranaerophilales bacterium]|nr:50S ribosomal protein L18 [Candidatus Gastranaerophilales bacterium]